MAELLFQLAMVWIPCVFIVVYSIRAARCGRTISEREAELLANVETDAVLSELDGIEEQITRRERRNVLDAMRRANG